MAASNEFATELVFAIAHEVGNHLGGIRLQAHMLDEDLDARSMAEASILIDDLAGRSGPLLSLMRPLLLSEWRAAGASPWSNLLARIQQQIEDQGTRGVQLTMSVEDGAAQEAVAPDFEWVHPLLVSLLESTIAHVGRGGKLEVRLEMGAGGATLLIEDDGEEEDLSPAAAPRGRPLALSIARALLGRIGGRVETSREADRSRVALIFV